MDLENSYAADSPAKCTVLISMKIKPYADTVAGIKAFFRAQENFESDFFFLEDVEKTWKTDQSIFKKTLSAQAIIAVGPEAVLFINSIPIDSSVLKVFTMISDPSALIGRDPSSTYCGFFLSVDAEDQITLIGKTLPQIRSLGVLYDPHYNQDYISKAQEVGSRVGIHIQSLMVRSKDEVPESLRNNWKQLDALLLIPDATVISASLVKYIIRDGISNNVPVIGYNHFFIQNGALMGFVYDYRQIGMQTGLLVKQQLLDKNTECRPSAARFNIEINKNIALHFNMEVNQSLEGILLEENE